MLSLTHSPAGDACWAVSFLLQNPCSLGSYRSTIELHPRQGSYYMHFAAERNGAFATFFNKSICSDKD